MNRQVLKAVGLGVALSLPITVAIAWATERYVDRAEIVGGTAATYVVEVPDVPGEMTVRELIAKLVPLNWDALVLVGRKGETAHFATRVYQTPRLDIPDGLVWIEADPGRGAAHAFDLERQAAEATCTVQRAADVIAERVRLTGRPNP